VRTTFGAVPWRDNLPAEDAVAVARLRGQGAILIGKTTTPEFGTKCLTDSPLFGRTRNAWDAGRTSGGSSGGAAVATDGGGSTCIHATSWYGAFVPGGTPADVQAKLEKMFIAASGNAASAAKLEALGLEVVARPGKDAQQRMLRERAAWKPIVEASGYVAEE